MPVERECTQGEDISLKKLLPKMAAVEKKGYNPT